MKIKLINVDNVKVEDVFAKANNGDSDSQLLLMAILESTASNSMRNFCRYYENLAGSGSYVFSSDSSRRLIWELLNYWNCFGIINDPDSTHVSNNGYSGDSSIIKTARAYHYFKTKNYGKALGLLEGGQIGNYFACYILGNIYGHSDEHKNFAKAVTYYDKVIAGGAPKVIMANALYERATLYDDSVPIIDWNKSLELLYQSAALGNKSAAAEIKNEKYAINLNSKRYRFVLEVLSLDSKSAAEHLGKSVTSDFHFLSERLSDLVDAECITGFNVEWICKYISLSETNVPDFHKTFGPFLARALMKKLVTIKYLIENFKDLPTLTSFVRKSLLELKGDNVLIRNLDSQVLKNFGEIKDLPVFIEKYISNLQGANIKDREYCKEWLDTIKDDILRSIDDQKKFELLKILVNMGYEDVRDCYNECHRMIVGRNINRHSTLNRVDSLESLKVLAKDGDSESSEYVSRYYYNRGETLYNNALKKVSGLTELKDDQDKYPEYKYWLMRFYEDTPNFLRTLGISIAEKYEQAGRDGCPQAYLRLGNIALPKDPDKASCYYFLATQTGLDCRKQLLDIGEVGAIYLAMLDPLVGSVDKYYGNASLKKLYTTGVAPQLSRIVLNVSAHATIDVHARMALLQLPIKDSSDNGKLKTKLVDLLGEELSKVIGDTRTLISFLRKICTYLEPKYFIDLAVAYFYEKSISYDMRCMILYTAKHLIESRSDDRIESGTIQELCKRGLVDNFAEIKNKLNFSDNKSDSPESLRTPVRDKNSNINFFPKLKEGQKEGKGFAGKRNAMLKDADFDSGSDNVPAMYWDPVALEIIDDEGILGNDGHFYALKMYQQLKGKKSPMNPAIILNDGIKVIGYEEELDKWVERTLKKQNKLMASVLESSKAPSNNLNHGPGGQSMFDSDDEDEKGVYKSKH